MNRIYRVIFSQVKGCFVVVSELAQAHTKKSTVNTGGQSYSLAHRSPLKVGINRIAFSIMALFGMVAFIPSALAASAELGGGHVNGASNALAVGDRANVKDRATRGIAIGFNAKVEPSNNGGDGLALGGYTYSAAGGAIAIGGGYNNQNGAAAGRDSTAIGYATNAIAARDSVVIGAKVAVAGQGNIILSRNNTENAHNGSGVVNVNSVDISGNDNIVIGSMNQLTANTKVNSAYSGGENYGIADIQRNTILGANNTILGGSTTGTQTLDNSILGSNNKINTGAGKNIIFGSNNTVESGVTGAYVLGSKITVNSSNSVYFGEGSVATLTPYLNTGTNTTADNADLVTKGITIGELGQTSTVIGGKTYNFAGQGTSGGGVITVGKLVRQSNGTYITQGRVIQNVAPGLIGAASTDAVNGSQLFALLDTINNEFLKRNDAINTYIDKTNGKFVRLYTDPSGSRTGFYYDNDFEGDGTPKTTANMINEDNIVVSAKGKASTLTTSTAPGQASGLLAYTNVKSVIGGTVSDSSNTFITGLAGAADTAYGSADRGKPDNTASQLNSAATIGDLKNLYLTPHYFSGDVKAADATANKFGRKANEETKIIGGKTAVADLSDNNIGVVSNGTDTLTIKLAKQLQGIESISRGTGDSAAKLTFTDGSNGTKATIGVNNAKIVGLAAGTDDTDAVNVSQLNAVKNSIQDVHWFNVNATKPADAELTDSNYDAAHSGAKGTDSVAIGNQALSKGVDGIAIGHATKAFGDGTIAIGSNIKSDSANVASESKAGVNAIVIGSGAGSKAGADGAAATVQPLGASSVAIGQNAYATQLGSTALGWQASATANAAQAFGGRASASGNSSIAIGTSATASGAQSIALGRGANASVDKSVALGNGSTTAAAVATSSATIEGLNFKNFAASSPSAVVSVGASGSERQIQNVAAGQITATSTDAINGSQLYDTNKKLGKLATSVKNNFGGNAKLDADTGEITFTDIGGTSKDTIHEAIAASREVVEAAANGGLTVDSSDQDSGAKKYTVKIEETLKSKIDNLPEDTEGELAKKADKTLANLDPAGKDVITGLVSGSAKTGDLGKYVSVDNVGGTNGTAKDIQIGLSQEAVDKLDAIDVEAGVAKANQTLALGGNDSTSTATQAFNKEGGLKFNIVGADSGADIKAAAVGDTVTLSLQKATAVTENDTKAVTSGAVHTAIEAAKTALTDKGLSFSADSGRPVKKSLGETLGIKGDDGYLGTAIADSGIKISLDQSVKDKLAKLEGIDTVAKGSQIVKLTAEDNKETTGQTLGQANPINFKVVGDTSIDTTASNDTITVEVAQGGITTDHIKDGTIQTGDLKDGAVTDAKLANGAVTTDKITDSSVTNDKLADNAVTTDKIANGSVTTDKLDKTVQDSINNANSALQSLVVGVDGSGADTDNKIDLSKTNQRFDIVGSDGVTTTIEGRTVKVKLDDTTKNTINNAADKNLSNLTDAGNNIIKNQAIGAIDVQRADNNNYVTVSNSTEDNKKTFKVGVNVADTITNEATASDDGNKNKVASAQAVRTAVVNAKTKVALADSDSSGILSVTKTESEDLTANSYTLGINTNKLKEALSDTYAAGTNTFKLTGDKNTSTDTQNLNKENGLSFGVIGKTGGAIETTASGSNVTIDIKDKGITAAKLADDITSKLGKANTAVQSLTVGADKNGTATGITLDNNTGNQRFDIVGQDGITTDVSDRKVTVTIDTAEISSDATTGVASVTDDNKGNKFATAESVATAINNAVEKASGASKLHYKANNTGDNEVLLSKGLDFTDGTNTTAEVAADGVVKFNVKPALTGITSISSGAGDNETAATIALTKGNDTNAPQVNVNNAQIANVKSVLTDIDTTVPDGKDNYAATLGDVSKLVGNSQYQYQGDNNTGASAVTIKRKPKQILGIKGGAATGTLSDNNIGTVADKDTGDITIKLAKVLSGLTSAEFKDDSGNTTTIGGNGITISPSATQPNPAANPAQTVSLTKDGLNNGGNRITNVAAPEADTDAANKKYVNDTVEAAANKARTKITGSGAAIVTKSSTDPDTYNVHVDQTTAFTDAEGNELVKGPDGHYYKAAELENKTWVKNDDGTYSVYNTLDINPDTGKPNKDATAQTTPTAQTVAGTKLIDPNASDTTPAKPQSLSNVASALGLDGTAGNDGTGEGSTADPKVISPEAAKKAIAGDNGNGGLLTKSGKDLNKATTLGDLQALAQAGLDFTGNNSDTTVHRPLGTKLSIVGDGVDKSASGSFTSASGNINVKASDTDNQLVIQLAKRLKNLEDATFTKQDAQGNPVASEPTTVVSNNGITISPSATQPDPATDPAQTVSLTKDGLDNGGNRITNVGAPTKDTDATNKQYVDDAVKAAADKARTKVTGSGAAVVTKSSSDPDVYNVHVDETSAFVDDEGNKLVKGEDGQYYQPTDLAGKTYVPAANGQPAKWVDSTGADTTAPTPKTIAGTQLVNPTPADGKDGTSSPVKLGNVAGVFKNNTVPTKDDPTADASANPKPQIADAAAINKAIDDAYKTAPTNAVNVADLKAVKDVANHGFTVKTEAKGGTVTNTGYTDGENINPENDTITFVAGANVHLKQEAGKITIATNDQAIVNNAQLPVAYTTKSGDKVYKVGDNFYTNPEGTGDVVPNNEVITALRGADGSSATPLANVGSGIGGKTDDNGNNTFLTNLNKVGADGADAVNPNMAVTTQDLKNLADTGHKIQTNTGDAVTVKAGETVQVVNGANTKVSTITSKEGVHTYSINVDGLPMAFKDAGGNPLVKVGDNFYKASDIDASTGQLKEGAEAKTPTGVTLLDKDGAAKSQVLSGLKSAIEGVTVNNADGTPKADATFVDKLAKAAKDDATPDAAVTVSDLNQVAQSGITFKGNNQDVAVTRPLGSTINIVGEGDFDGKDSAADNIAVVGDKAGTLTVKLAKNLKNLDSVAFTDKDSGNTTKVDGNGITITPTSGSPISLTQNGLDNGGNRITNVGTPTEATDAVNKAYVDSRSSKVEAGNNIQVSETIAPNGSTVYTVSTSKDTHFDSITIPSQARGNVVINSSGLNNGGNRIANVAPGVAAGDAVNLGQVQNIEAGLRKGIRSAKATSAALASLPTVYHPGKNAIGAGIGYSGGRSALAVGVSSMSDNGKWIAKGVASYDGEDPTAGVGITYQW